MDLSKSLVSMKEGLLSAAGLTDKDITAAGEKVGVLLHDAGIDQGAAAMILLGVAGLLFLCLVGLVVRRTKSESIAIESSYSEERIAALEQMLHDIKTQLSMVKGQVKADFGYLRQEVTELRESMGNSTELSPTYTDPEDHTLAANGR